MGSQPGDPGGNCHGFHQDQGGLHHGELWFGTGYNVGRLLARAADELGIPVHVLS